MEQLTQVIFRKFKDGTLVAVFPYDIYNHTGTVWCYHPVGQHAQCDYGAVMANSSPATEAEYSRLKKELENRPYNYKLVVIGRRSYWTYLKALNELKSEGAIATL